MSNAKKELYIRDYGGYVAGRTGYASFRNNLRLKKLLPFINPHPKEKILEIGCNDGLFTRKVAEYGSDVIGVDVNSEMIVSLHDSRFYVMSGTDLYFPADSFDKVYSFETVEHIPEIESFFSETYRVLKKGGHLIISFPWEIIRGQAAIRDALAIYKDISYARKLHVHKLSPSKVKEILKRNRIPFEVRTISLCAVPFFSYVMVFEK